MSAWRFARRAWVGTALVSAVACAPKLVVDPLDVTPLRYRVDLSAELQTTGADASGAAVHALSPIAQTGLDAHVVLSVQPARTFRDGSMGTLVVFEEAWMEHHLPGRPSTVEAPAGLQGRSVELRTFPGDEILTIDLVEHIVGAGRYGDVLDVVFPVLAPYPPSLDDGARATRELRWPVVVDNGRVLRNRLALTWHNRGLGEVRGEPAWQLAYTGSWTGKARDVLVAPDVPFARVQGSASGTAWYRSRDAELVVHEFDWTRVVTARFPTDGDGHVQVEQRQHYTGRLERVSP